MMKALVVKPGREVGFVEKPIPIPGADDAIIKTTIAAVCTSDPHAVYSGTLESWGKTGVTVGHEAVGIVHEVGCNVKSFKVGDRVAVGTVTPCYKCENCLNGYTSHCGGMGGGMKYITQKDGSLAEYFHVNDAESNMAHIPDTVSDEAAIYATEMMAVAYNGVTKADFPIGGTVAIFAQGPIGLMSTAMARIRGAGLIIAVETNPQRQELAKRYGADIIVDFNKVDPVEEILRITNLQGVDASIEALGHQSTFESCIKATRPGGTISVVGWFLEGDYIKIPRVEWGNGIGDKKIESSFVPGGKLVLDRILRLIENGRIDPTHLTTHRFSFDEAEKPFRMMQTKEDNIIKPLVFFQ